MEDYTRNCAIIITANDFTRDTAFCLFFCPDAVFVNGTKAYMNLGLYNTILCY